jgi:phosphoserine phosphatase
MLEKVGMPMVVNPDKLLEAEAKKRGWPIIMF